MEERCLICGEIIPEGRQICPICEMNGGPERERVTCGDFAEWLRRQMEEKQLSRYKLADKAGLSHVAIKYYEDGERCPRFDTLEMILKALGKHIEIVEGGQNE